MLPPAGTEMEDTTMPRKINVKGEQPVTIRFPTELHGRIKALAERDMRSFNSEVIWLLDRATTEAESERSS